MSVLGSLGLLLSLLSLVLHVLTPPPEVIASECAADNNKDDLKGRVSEGSEKPPCFQYFSETKTKTCFTLGPEYICHICSY